MSETNTVRALTSDALTQCLVDLPAWQYDADRKAIFRSICLKDFSEAFALMLRIALEAEKADHHPEWSNVYNRIDIWLTTHDADGVSARDVALARLVDGMTPA